MRSRQANDWRDRPEPGDPHDRHAALERARREFTCPEYERVVHHAEEAADRAATRAVARWASWLAIAGLLVAVALRHPGFALLAALLAIFYALPVIVAGLSTVRGEEERRDLTRSIHEHEHSVSPASGGAPGARPPPPTRPAPWVAVDPERGKRDPRAG